MVEAEASLGEFAERNPQAAVTTAVARQRARPGCGPRTSTCSHVPAVPMILGFDPRYQFVHETTWCTPSSTPQDRAAGVQRGGDGVLR